MKAIITSLLLIAASQIAIANSTVDPVAPNTAVNCAIYPAGDVDYFSIALPVAGRFTVGSVGSTDTFGYLLNAAGSVLAANDDAVSGNPNFGITANLNAGTYFVAVRHYSAWGVGSYQLVNSFAPAVTPDDFGNTIATAARLSLTNNRASISGMVGAPGDVDVFAVTIPQAGTLQAGTTGSTDTCGGLFRANGQGIVANDNNGTDRNFAVAASLNAGTYYVVVAHASSGTGSYGLNVAFLPTTTTGGGTSTRVALVVGINDYVNSSVNDLGACVNDARDISSRLTASGWRVTVLTDRQATKTAIRNALKTLPRGATQFLFYYSGHGTNLGTMSAICPADCSPTSTSSMLSETELRSDLSTVASTTKVGLVFDSCHSGYFVGRSLTASATARAKVRYLPMIGASAQSTTGTDSLARALTSNGYVVITGCRGNQLSIELPDGSNGYLTSCIKAGLGSSTFDSNRNRQISLEETFAACAGRDTGDGQRQDPQLFDGNGTAHYELINY